MKAFITVMASSIAVMIALYVAWDLGYKQGWNDSRGVNHESKTKSDKGDMAGMDREVLVLPRDTALQLRLHNKR